MTQTKHAHEATVSIASDSARHSFDRWGNRGSRFWDLPTIPREVASPRDAEQGPSWLSPSAPPTTLTGSSPTLSEAGTEAQRRTETCSKAHSLWWLSLESGRGFGAQFSHCAARSGPERGPSKPAGELGTGQIPTRRPSAEGGPYAGGQEAARCGGAGDSHSWICWAVAFSPGGCNLGSGTDSATYSLGGLGQATSPFCAHLNMGRQ